MFHGYFCILIRSTENLSFSQAKPEEVQRAVENALNSGYRLIDTAPGYGNEEAIGEIIEKWLHNSGHSREEIFLTTKVNVFFF